MAIIINEDQKALSLHAETASQRENKIEIIRNLLRPAESEDDDDSDCPILSSLQNAEGSSAMQRMTNFTTRKFHKHFSKFENKIKSN